MTIRPPLVFALIFCAGCGIGACAFHTYWCERYETRLSQIEREQSVTRLQLDIERNQRAADHDAVMLHLVIIRTAFVELFQKVHERTHRTEPEPQVERIPPANVPPLPPVVTDPEGE